MASSGAEEVKIQTFQPTFGASLIPTVVHVPNGEVVSCKLQRRGLQPSEPSVTVANVNVGLEQLLCVSGTSTHCAFPVQAAYPSVARVDGVWSSGVSCTNGITNSQIISSVVAKNSQCSSAPLVFCQNPFRLEPSIHSSLPHKHLGSHRLRSGLLGKRAFSFQPAVYPVCPSPPKATSKFSEISLTKSTMPTNQSSPQATSKFNGNSNGFLQPATTQVPVHPRQKLRDLANPSTTPSLSTSHQCRTDKGSCKTDTKLSCPTVPLQKNCRDVILGDTFGVGDMLKSENVAGSVKVVQPNNVHQGLRVLGTGKRLSTEVSFTAAVRTMARNSVKLSNGALHATGRAPATQSTTAFVLRPENVAVDPVPSADVPPVTPALLSALPLTQVDQGSNLVAAKPSSLPGLRLSCSTSCSSDASYASGGKGHAIPGETMDELTVPQSPSVYSVTTQISAIHLTKQSVPLDLIKDKSFSLPLLEEQAATNHSVTNHEGTGLLQVAAEEDELPDNVENDCNGDEDDGSECSSMNDGASAASVVISSSVEEAGASDQEDSKVEKPALVPSLFPYIPPTLYFGMANETVELLPPEQRKLLKWKMSSVTPNVVKNAITRSHFTATKKSHDWLGCWGHHMKSPGFKAIREYQKLNHFPGSFQIGRKDRLWRNLSKMQVRFGKQEFGFFPRSFVLPQDIKLLRKAWEDGGSRQKWIIKPPASARGIGIQVIHKWSQMPRRRPLLVQKYLHKPYLISGNKFDLRIYVYVSSFDPLRIYIFNDGLVRFASCKYSSSMKSLGNKFMHLTNYSVNKKNSEYQNNSDDKSCQGHKWSLKALWWYLGSKGVNTSQIWEKIKDIVIKTIIASDPYVNTLVKTHVRSPYSCHELFGFDIMLDENLKPWVLEVNISPSLHSRTPLDIAVKSQMIRDVLNLAGFVLPQCEDVVPSGSNTSSSSNSFSLGMRLRSRHLPELLSDEKVKKALLKQHSADQDFFSAGLEELTAEDIWMLAESEDELSRRGQFERLFPSPMSSRYLRFFERQRYLNILLNQWEQKYCQNRDRGISLLKNLCERGLHLGPASDPARLLLYRSISGQSFDSYSNLSAVQEPITSSVVVSEKLTPEIDEDDFVIPSPPDIGLLGSCGSSPCSSSASESLNSKDYM
uniref:Tubulin tyrosine ligase-like family, member 4 n=1 Tax=Paramormyrops kingsleyae TaxID=1676925 RepID=A0A3B3RFF0_9TELE|nr:tubulin polyglutamylase TTLL4 isoform X1 [Paramormyrops kingsleyae]XP_023661843.1 tubulin polyglutamylase TTLL4 isoform X1 [Paramormyrops kingsleyae]